MEKRLRSSLQSSADEFLSSAARLSFKSSKTTIKTIINTLISPSSDLTSTLPLSLRNSISRSISQFKNLSDSSFVPSPTPPPAKRVRRSARNKKRDGVSTTKDSEDERQSLVQKLQVYAYILRLCVFHPKDVFSDSDFLPAAQELQDNLILFEADSDLLSEIANLCEEWWKRDLLGKDTLISQSLPVILSRSLTLKKKVDVHRVYTLREAFTLFDFEDESIEDLKHLMIRCVISPLYLKTEDGRKFIAFMFGLSVQLIKEVFAMIKSQIPFGRKSMLEAYGETILRAWKAVEGECKDEIENGVIEPLLEGAIYASSRQFGASLRRVLGCFVTHRTIEGVEKLIFRLAEPVIFRSLQAANSNVRQNALHLLLDLFPLEDPDATKEAKDTLLEKQFFLLEKLLMDECPDVRVVAVEGICRILHLFWEVIPSSSITTVITRIFDDMTHDNCTEVRFSTVNGVIYLLGNPQSHELLKVLLPRLGHLIMDSVSVVRAAVVDLLLILNDIRNFHFHKVVRLDVLLSTLANDQPLVARKITKLLIPSYFPSKVIDDEACNRCVTLIKRSPAAGARFCEFATSEGASPKLVLKLFRVLIGLILSSELDEAHMEGFLLAASHLCTDLANDAAFHTYLKEELTGERLKILFTVASSARAQSSVCNIVSVTSLNAIGDLSKECMSLITNCNGLPDNVERQAEVRSAHKMMLSCGCFDNMFEAMVEFLQKAANSCQLKFGIESGKEDVQSVKRKKTKSSSNLSSKSRNGSGKRLSDAEEKALLEEHAIAAGVAWQIKDLLLSENTRKDMLSSGILGSAYFALKAISEASIVHSLQYDYRSASPILAYTTLSLHMSLHKITIDKSKDSLQASVAASTMEHVLNCANKVITQNNCKESAKSPSESGKPCLMTSECSKNPGDSRTGVNLPQVRISNIVKILTAVLKFIVDATALDLVPVYQERGLNFAAHYLQFIISRLREHSIAQLQVTEEDLKDIFYCLKSSFTYAAKLLNIMLGTCGDPLHLAGAYSLVNEMFNLIVVVEELLGYNHGARFITAVHPWVPDLILALGSHCLLKEIPEEGGCSYSYENITLTLPSWFYILARIELHELTDFGLDEETQIIQHAEDFSAFKRLMETISQRLKSNPSILDAVGVIFLTGTLKALENKKFDIVLGLLHFVCTKLVKPEDREWEGVKLMLGCIGDLYPKLEAESELGHSDGDRKKLHSARTLLEPMWTSFIHDEGRYSMEEE